MKHICKHNFLPYTTKDVLDSMPGRRPYKKGTIVKLVYCTKCLEILEIKEIELGTHTT